MSSNIEIDISKTQYTSLVQPFKMSSKTTFYGTVTTSGPLAVGQAAYVVINTPLENENDISSIMVKYDGLEDFWRYLDGSTYSQFPDIPNREYEVGSYSYFTDGVHHLLTYVANQSASPVNIPTFILRFQLNLYDTPFQ